MHSFERYVKLLHNTFCWYRQLTLALCSTVLNVMSSSFVALFVGIDESAWASWHFVSLLSEPVTNSLKFPPNRFSKHTMMVGFCWLSSWTLTIVFISDNCLKNLMPEMEYLLKELDFKIYFFTQHHFKWLRQWQKRTAFYSQGQRCRFWCEVVHWRFRDTLIQFSSHCGIGADLFVFTSRYHQTLIYTTPGTSCWYNNLRGWLGVQNQINIYIYHTAQPPNTLTVTVLSEKPGLMWKWAGFSFPQ